VNTVNLLKSYSETSSNEHILSAEKDNLDNTLEDPDEFKIYTRSLYDIKDEQNV